MPRARNLDQIDGAMEGLPIEWTLVLAWKASNQRKLGTFLMNLLIIIIIIVAVVLAITGGLVQSVNFLLWVGIVLLILAVIAWLIRSISGRSRV
jgi:small-conductance mechanosensitive channel